MKYGFYRSAASIVTGSSSSAFHVLEKRAMAAPSTTRWSAAHDTVITWHGTTASPPRACARPGSDDAKRGTRLILPSAPIATWRGSRMVRVEWRLPVGASAIRVERGHSCHAQGPP